MPTCHLYILPRTHTYKSGEETTSAGLATAQMRTSDPAHSRCKQWLSASWAIAPPSHMIVYKVLNGCALVYICSHLHAYLWHLCTHHDRCLKSVFQYQNRMRCTRMCLHGFQWVWWSCAAHLMMNHRKYNNRCAAFKSSLSKYLDFAFIFVPKDWECYLASVPRLWESRYSAWELTWQN
jgi:hypothetical protein